MPTYEFKKGDGPTFEIESQKPLAPAQLQDFARQVSAIQVVDVPPESPPSVPFQRTREVGKEVLGAYKGLGQAGLAVSEIPQTALSIDPRVSLDQRKKALLEIAKRIGSGLKGSVQAGKVGPFPILTPGGPLWGFQGAIPQDVAVESGAVKRGGLGEEAVGWGSYIAPILPGAIKGAVGLGRRAFGKPPTAPVSPPELLSPHPQYETGGIATDKPRFSMRLNKEGGYEAPRPLNPPAMREILRTDPNMRVSPGGPTYAEIFNYEVPTDRPRILSWAQRLWEAAKSPIKSIKEGLPQDYRLHTENPKGTPVMSVIDNGKDIHQADLENLLRNIKWFVMHDPEAWVDAEFKASQAWRKLIGPFQSIPDKILEMLPKGMREARMHLRDMEREEEAAARYLGERFLPRETTYVIPHVADKDFSHVVKIGEFSTGVSADLKSTLGAFEKPRTHPTIFEGRARGEKYVDPRLGMLYRLYTGKKLIHTYRIVKGLEDQKAIFQTAKEAAAARPQSAGQAWKVEGIPGSKTWWAGTESEAKFIADMFRSTPRAIWSTKGYGTFLHYSNKLFRNYQLINPLPHGVKNIGYKYGFSGASRFRLPGYLKDYQNKALPETALFEQLFSRIAKDVLTPGEIMRQMRMLIQGNKMLYRLERLEPYWQRDIVFNKMDRFMKYARFREYLRKGVNPHDALIQTQTDLIRYAMRSKLLDIWHAFPMNYFATWRLGTVQSLYKNIRENKLQAMMWLAGWDLMREAIYRGTGWWFHSPIDYVEAPVVNVIEKLNDSYAKGGASAVLDLMGAAALGPGGHVHRLLVDIVGAVNKGELPRDILDDIKKSLWGMGNMVGVGMDIYGIGRSINSNDPKAWSNLILAIVAGAHDATNYRPRRAMEIIPQTWMRNAPRVQKAEDIQNYRDAIRKRQEMGRQMRGKRPSISDIVGND